MRYMRYMRYTCAMRYTSVTPRSGRRRGGFEARRRAQKYAKRQNLAWSFPSARCQHQAQPLLAKHDNSLRAHPEHPRKLEGNRQRSIGAIQL